MLVKKRTEVRIGKGTPLEILVALGDSPIPNKAQAVDVKHYWGGDKVIVFEWEDNDYARSN